MRGGDCRNVRFPRVWDLTKQNNVYKELFLQQKPADMLVFLKQGNGPRYATQVAKGVDCTYSHTIKILEAFRSLGLVKFQKRGRIKLITLTGDGEEMAHDIEGIVRKMGKLHKANSKQPVQKPEPQKKARKRRAKR